MAVLLGGKRTAGFFVPGRFCPDPELFLPYPLAGSERERLLALVTFLGAPSRGSDLEFPRLSGDVEELERLDPGGRLRPGAYACVHPGGRTAARRWAPERFARVGDLLSREGLTVVLTGNTEERQLTAHVAGLMDAPAVDLAGRTSLGGLAELLARARILVSNDTGVAHVADAVGVPSVIVFDPAQIDRWAPADRTRQRVLSPVGRVTPDMVMAEAAALIGSTTATRDTRRESTVVTET